MMPPEPDAEIIRVWPLLPVDAAAGRLPMLAATIASPRSNRIKRGPAWVMHPPCGSTPAAQPGSLPESKQHIDDQSTPQTRDRVGQEKKERSPFGDRSGLGTYFLCRGRHLIRLSGAV